MKRAALLLLLWAAPSSAEEGGAAKIFAEAQQAFEHGDLRRAAQGFDEANRLSPHGKTTLNAALAWEAAGEIAIAADRYAAALASGQLAPERTRETQDKLDLLEKRLCLLSVEGPPALLVSVAHVPAAPLPLRLHLTPGLHTLELSGGPGPERREITVLAGTRVSLDLTRPAPSPAAAVLPLVAPAAPAAEGSGPWLALGVSGLGAGVALGAVSAILGGLTMGALGDYRDGGYTDVALYERATGLRSSTNILLGVAIGATVVGGVMLMVHANQEDP